VSEPATVATPSLETIPFAVLVDEAWRSSRRHARRVLGPLLLALAPAALVMQVVVALWNLQMLGADAASADFSSMCGMLAIGGVVLLLAGVWFAAVYGTMMVATTEALAGDGEPPSVAACARRYLQPRVWGTDLLAWFLTGLGLLACVLPGLLLLAVWSLRIPVMVREERYGLAALARSWELLAHNPSRQLVRHPVLKVGLLFVLGMVLGYAVSLVVQAPAIVVNQLLLFRELAQGEAGDPAAAVRATLWLTIPSGVLAALAQLTVQLYVDFAVSHLYFDQRRRKEGGDLEASLDQLLGGAAPADVASPR
jgi:uncharacterized membrane protein